MKEVNLKEMDIPALKALCYDLLVQSQQLQNQINIVQQELNSRKEEKND